jgi:hypothetical protein
MPCFHLYAEAAAEVELEIEAETLEEAKQIFADRISFVDYANETIGVDDHEATVRWGIYDIDSREVFEM